MRSRARGPVAFLVASWLAAGVVACSPSSTDTSSAATCTSLQPTCVSPPPSWSTAVQPIISRYCYPCHGPGGVEQPAFDFTSYGGVSKSAQRILVQVATCRMPPANAVVPLADREALLAWIACGAPND